MTAGFGAQTGDASGEAGVHHEGDDPTHAGSQQACVEEVPQGAGEGRTSGFLGWEDVGPSEPRHVPRNPSNTSKSFNHTTKCNIRKKTCYLK